MKPLRCQVLQVFSNLFIQLSTSKYLYWFNLYFLTCRNYRRPLCVVPLKSFTLNHRVFRLLGVHSKSMKLHWGRIMTARLLFKDWHHDNSRPMLVRWICAFLRERERQQEGSVARIQYVTSSSSTSHSLIEMWNLEAKETPQICYCPLQTIPEPCLLSGRAHYCAERGLGRFALFPKSLLAPREATHTHTWSCLLKKMIRKFRPPSSIAVWSSPDVDRHIVGAFHCKQGSTRTFEWCHSKDELL